jgi:hypothetical protein
VKPIQFKVQRRVQRWFVRRRGLIKIVGGMIILATFLVKDVLRDQEKDIVETINSAESLYLIRDASLELHKEIDEVDANVNKDGLAILKALPPIRNNESKKADWQADFDRNEDRLLRAEIETYSEVDNLSRLIAKAPPSPEHLKQYSELYWQWDKLRMAEFAIPVKRLDEATPDDSKATYNRDLKTYADVWLANRSLDMVGAMILDDAHYIKERKEHRVRVFTPISYVLFVLGVLVTLASELFGIEDEGVGE